MGIGLKMYESIPVGKHAKVNVSKTGIGGSIKTPIGRVTRTARGKTYLTTKLFGSTIKIPMS